MSVCLILENQSDAMRYSARINRRENYKMFGVLEWYPDACRQTTQEPEILMADRDIW